MTKDYEKYMKKCINLAKKGEGRVSPNPLAGAVILDKNGKIAGAGYHEKYGEAHAEVNAFIDAEKKGIDVRGGTIFVSLEPCSHYGKTPPCADLIIKKGIIKVVVGCVDPNPLVAGNGIKKLQAVGIEVISGVLEKECIQLNEIFFKNMSKQLPFVAIKTAATLDGKIASKTGSSKWITSKKAREYVQKLRNKYDAILTGSGTVIIDNPSLTCRLQNKNLCKNPVRIIIDSELKTNPESKVYNNDLTKVYLACAENSFDKGYGSHVELIKCPLNKESGKIDLEFLITKLYDTGIRSILVEAGGSLNGAFIRAGLADRLYQFIAPKIAGDKTAKNFVEGFDLNEINECQNLSIVSIKNLNPDVLIEANIHSI